MEKISITSIDRWIRKVSELANPDRVYVCDGSEKEYKSILDQMVKEEEIIRLNEERYPDCYLYRSNPMDVARTEKSTYICSEDPEDVGPLNNYMSVDQADEICRRLIKGSMKGKTMYVVPYVMGPLSSSFSEIGVEITDSPYVVANMKIMTRMGTSKIESYSDREDWIKGIHVSGNLDPKNRYILHFPWKRTDLDAHIVSINSAYGGNALLSKKCHALRIASVKAKEEGWMAEHMLLLEVETPSKKKYYFSAAFPSASGKTNLAMIKPPKRYAELGWKTRLIGDDIAWIRPGKDGRLYAINPENGFFGVVPGTNYKTNPNAMETMRKNTIFTNVALTETGDPWWEGLPAPNGKIFDWQGEPIDPSSGKIAAHPNSRFTSPIEQYPEVSDQFNNPIGVPLAGIIFGGRRETTIPLVFESFDWNHGVFLGASMGVEQTAAAEGKVGVIRRDPMAMRPFIGYNVSAYFDHWLSFGTGNLRLPKIFYVNWFRKNREGKYIWPGFGENLRVIEWMIKRVENTVPARETEIGYMPDPEDIESESLPVSEEDMKLILSIDRSEWKREISDIGNFLDSLGKELPQKIKEEYGKLSSRFVD